MDLCAEAILDIAFPETKLHAEDSELIYHLVNPKVFSWKHDLLPALQQSQLPNFDVVSTEEWLDKLKHSDQDLSKNPSLKLVDFWQRKYGSPTTQVDSAKEQDDDAPGLHFETAITEGDSSSIASAIDPVSDGLIERYVSAWMKRWNS